MTQPRAVPVVLVGPMATGKTVVGRMLAARRGVAFIDTDRRIVERHGPIAGIFASQGEAGFRRLEALVVRETLESGGGDVVALGGGAVLDAGTRAALGNAYVIFLDTDLATVLPRILPDTGRPLLTGNPAERWAELYRQRRTLYEEVADLVVDTRRRSLKDVLEQVVRRLALQQTEVEPTGAQPLDESRTPSHGN
ncbi:shikimate kinase [Arthrobacter sp. Br18]|uniref:shikimate kinase n=1 Tax=Arthrobacter sp. Br18 TaxID=1312954 RepID=UPI0004B0A3F5|nr:shikimate kinase [Arthrobacter sp. Br18]